MKRTHRFVVLALISMFALAVVNPAMATESSTEDASTETTVVPEQISEGEGPAVEVPAAEAEVVEQPWTARFIYPLIVVVTILLIVGLAIGYNHSIRNRYQVVN